MRYCDCLEITNIRKRFDRSIPFVVFLGINYVKSYHSDNPLLLTYIGIRRVG